MVREGQTIVRMDGWDGGLIKESNQNRLAFNELVQAQNMDIGPRGALIGRAGYSDASLSDPAAMGEGVWLFHFARDTMVDHLIYIDADDDVFDTTSNASLPLTFARSQYTGPTDVDCNIDTAASVAVSSDVNKYPTAIPTKVNKDVAINRIRSEVLNVMII